jgi:hypothetical protein
MTLNPLSVCARQPQAAFHRFGADTVVLDSSGTVLRGLNGTGAKVWELLDGQRTLGQIASALADEFQVPKEKVETEVAAFLSLLLNKQLVSVREP